VTGLNTNVNLPIIPALSGGLIAYAARKLARRSSLIGKQAQIVGADTADVVYFASVTTISIVLGILAIACADPDSPFRFAVVWGLGLLMILIGGGILTLWVLLTICGPEGIRPYVMLVGRHITAVITQLMALVAFVITFLYAKHLQLENGICILVTIPPLLFINGMGLLKNKACATAGILGVSGVCFVYSFNVDTDATAASAYLMGMYIVAAISYRNTRFDFGKCFWLLPVIAYLPLLQLII